MCLALSLDPPFMDRTRMRKRLRIPVVRKSAKALQIDVLEGKKLGRGKRWVNPTLKAAVLSTGFCVAPQSWPPLVRNAFRFPPPPGGKANQQGALLEEVPIPFEVACTMLRGEPWKSRKVDPCEDAILHAWLAGIADECLIEVFELGDVVGLHEKLANAIRGYMKLKRFALWALGTDLSVACRTKEMLESEKSWREGGPLINPQFFNEVWDHLAIRSQKMTGKATRPRQRPLFMPDAVFFDSFLKERWERGDNPSSRWLALNRMLFEKSMKERGAPLPTWYKGPVYHEVEDTRTRRGGPSEHQAPSQAP